MEAEGLYLKQNTAVPSLRGGPTAGNGAMRIAMHYKFSLDHAFGREPEVCVCVLCVGMSRRTVVKALWTGKISTHAFTISLLLHVQSVSLSISNNIKILVICTKSEICLEIVRLF